MLRKIKNSLVGLLVIFNRVIGDIFHFLEENPQGVEDVASKMKGEHPLLNLLTACRNQKSKIICNVEAFLNYIAYIYDETDDTIERLEKCFKMFLSNKVASRDDNLSSFLDLDSGLFGSEFDDIDFAASLPAAIPESARAFDLDLQQVGQDKRGKRKGSPGSKEPENKRAKKGR